LFILSHRGHPLLTACRGRGGHREFFVVTTDCTDFRRFYFGQKVLPGFGVQRQGLFPEACFFKRPLPCPPNPEKNQASLYKPSKRRGFRLLRGADYTDSVIRVYKYMRIYLYSDTAIMIFCVVF
jgi:hypothetical protein